MKYKLVRSATVDIFDDMNVVAAMGVRGYEYLGENHSPAQRAELQGAPRFKGLVGPMWDGDMIRYETPEMYEILSR